MKNRTLIIISAGIIILITSLFAVYRLTMQSKNNPQMEKLSTHDGKIIDPYIAGPVKNRILKGYVDINRCYRDYLKSEPKTKEGTLKVDWQIETNGSVITPEIVTGTIRDLNLERCITESISKWKFPEPENKKYISHDFKFKFLEKK
jgi:hypothetical protein